MSLNSREYQLDQSLFVEKAIETSFQIKKNPEGLPLINGNNVFSLANGEQIELTKKDKISQYGDKILIKKENTVYFKDEGKLVFDKINFSEKGFNVNHKSFEKYGQVFLSSYNDGGDKPSSYTYWIDGDVYTMPIVEGTMRFGDDSCDVQVKGDKIYAHWGMSLDFYVYNINKETNKLILDSKHSLSSDQSMGSILDDGSFGEKYIEHGKTGIKINNISWKNLILDQQSSFEKDGNVIYFWNKNELVINDKKYPLGERKGEIMGERGVKLSQDGNKIMIAYSYDKYNSDKKGDYILLGDKHGITKEVKNDFGGILKMAVKDENTFAYVTNAGQNSKNLVINGYNHPIDIKDDRYAIKELSFVDDTTVNIKYIDSQDNLIHKHISLDSNAEEIQKRKEQLEQEKKSEFEMMGWLKEHDISTMEQLQKLFDDAKKIDGLSKNLQEEQKMSYGRNLEIDALKNEKFKLDNERLSLKSEVVELRSNMETLKNGISSGALGYKLSSDAKRILGK